MDKYENALDEIYIINTAIEKNIDLINEDNRGFISQNILSYLRNFLEAVAFYYYCKNVKEDLVFKYEYIKNDIFPYCSSVEELNVISKLHEYTQRVSSHYTQKENESATILLNFFEYLLDIKELLEKEDIIVLSNIDKIPEDLDTSLKEYYTKILDKLDSSYEYVSFQNTENLYVCYVTKSVLCYINKRKFYEIEIMPATDYASKFDKVIAFSLKKIPTNYAIRVDIFKSIIHMYGNNIPITIIKDYRISIRACEFKNFAKLFGLQVDVKHQNNEYKNYMDILTNQNLSLVDLMNMDDSNYDSYVTMCTLDAKNTDITLILNTARDFLKQDSKGSNVIRYLLYVMRNIVIKDQYGGQNIKLSNLYLENGCIPFDDMPFCSNVKKHRVQINDLLSCIDFKNREHELVADKLMKITNDEGIMYVKKNNFKMFDKIDELIEIYNNKLWWGHKHREILSFSKYYYFRGIEDDTKYIFEKLKQLTDETKDDYYSFIQSNTEIIEQFNISDDKKYILYNLFSDSKLHLIYGPAGTGKTTLLSYISDMFDNYNKLYVTNTNAALLSLKTKISKSNSNFSTIAKLQHTSCNILFVDECSAISNESMRRILEKVNFDVAIFVGDNYQIESIDFGNWFNIAPNILDDKCVNELSMGFRTTDDRLKDFWESVRYNRDDITSKLVAYGYMSEIDESLFERTSDSEIILCLNYDGVYGINNINKLFQNRNPNKEYSYGINTYKVGDPILFNETNIYEPALTNNLQGRILNIIERNNYIVFEIEVDKVILDSEANNLLFDSSFVLIERKESSTIIKLTIDKNISSHDETKKNSVIPFQVAYAVSIHKSQGLEYDSVKIIVTNQNNDNITHNVFYTAVTRAKKYLKIYWSEETANKVIKGLEINKKFSDVSIFGNKCGFNVKRKK